MNAFTPFTRISLATSLVTLSLFSASLNAKELDAHEHGAARLTIATSDKGFEVSLESPSANVFGFEYTPSSDEDHHTIHEAVEVLEAGNALFLASESAGCQQSSVEIESAQVKSHDEAKHEDHDEHDHDEKHEKEEHAEKDDHKDHDEHGHDDEKHAEKDEHKDHDDHGHDDEKHAEKDDHKGHDDHGHDDEKHAEKDDHKDHDEHDHSDHKDEAGSTHNDVDVTWHFECKNVSDIKQVEVKLFSAFPKGFEDLDVDWISADKAGHAELGKDGIISLK